MSRQTYELKATVRTRVGKGSARALRREGLIPAVIYGDKKSPLPIAIPVKETSLKLYAGGFLTTVATIDVDGEKVLVLPKDYSRDPVRDFLIHVDFQRIAAGSTVTVWVPLHSKGEATSPGLKKGGALNWVRKEIECSCPAEAIPEYIEVDVSGLDIAESLHISAVKLPEGVKPVIQDRDFTIASITPPAGFNDAA
jgi:large subunit ribosomal protein L25